MSLKDQIQSCNDTELVPYEIPEWGLNVYIKKSLTLAENMELAELEKQAVKSKLPVSVHCLRFYLCDEDGSPIFTKDDVGILLDKRQDVLNRIFDKIHEIVKPADVEEEEKNSDQTTS